MKKKMMKKKSNNEMGEKKEKRGVGWQGVGDGTF